MKVFNGQKFISVNKTVKTTFPALIRNKDKGTKDVETKKNNTISKNTVCPSKTENHSVRDNGIDSADTKPVNVWNKKPGASLFKGEASTTNGQQESAIVRDMNGIHRKPKISFDPAIYRLRGKKFKTYEL